MTTKSFATLDALERVQRWFSPSTVIVLLQNGIGMQQQVVESYPGLAVIAGVTTDGAYRRGPFQVVHAGRGKTRFGAIAATPPARVEQLRRCFAEMSLEVEWVDDIWPSIWHKVAINCCINAPTALAQCRNGALLERDESRQQIEGLVREIQQVMQAAGCEFAFPDLYREVLDVIAATAGNYSSMCEDLRAGRRTEIDYINGFICALGDQHGVDTPLNRALVNAILSL